MKIIVMNCNYNKSKNRKRSERCIVSFLALVMFINKNVLASDYTSKFNEIGMNFLRNAQMAAYFIFAIMCSIEILKTVISKKANEVPSIIIKYLIAFACFYAVPSLFDVIRDIF